MSISQAQANPRLRGQRCVGCDALYPPEEDLLGCPVCRDAAASNLAFDYALSAQDRGWIDAWAGRPAGLWAHEELLPLPAAAAVTLGEGATPLLECERAGRELGLPRLLIKDESQNPTWSFKDRLATVAVSWAKALGRPGIAVSSSGNAGAAAAAYAARAGLPCIAFTAPAFTGAMQRFMRSYGAMVVATPDAASRWELNRAVAREWGFLPVSNTMAPAIGSHPAAVEGCKTVAFEIARDLGWRAPAAVVVPTAFGDLLAGLHLGFQQLRAIGALDSVPKLIAVETGGSLTRALEQSAGAPLEVPLPDSRALSVGVVQSTAQALVAVKDTGGTALMVSDAEILDARGLLSRLEGMFVERSAAMAVAGAHRLAAAGTVGPDDVVVAISTSSGLKDMDMDEFAQLPVTEPDLGELERLLAREHGFRP